MNEPPLELISRVVRRNKSDERAEQRGDLRELVEDVAVARELLGDGRGGGGGGGAAAHGVVDVLQLAEQRLDLELHGLPGGAVGGGGGGARGGGGGGARGEARVGGELYVEVALQLARLPPQLLPPGLLQLQRRCRRVVRRRHHRLRRRRRLGSDRIQSAVIWRRNGELGVASDLGVASIVVELGD